MDATLVLRRYGPQSAAALSARRSVSKLPALQLSSFRSSVCSTKELSATVCRCPSCPPSSFPATVVRSLSLRIDQHFYVWCLIFSSRALLSRCLLSPHVLDPTFRPLLCISNNTQSIYRHGTRKLKGLKMGPWSTAEIEALQSWVSIKCQCHCQYR